MDSGLDFYQQALVIQMEAGDRFGGGATLKSIGMVYDRQGKYNEALKAYQQALVIASEGGYSALEEAVLTNIKKMTER